MDWVRFRERFPGASDWFGFSRVKFTADRLDGLLYYDRFCAGACGEGEYVWFHRDNPQAEFSLAKERVVWIS
jgi:hypothetical protein